MADYLSKAEFSRAIALMQAMRDSETLDLLGFMQGDMVMFDGFGLHKFEPVPCTMYQLSQLIAYQCIQFSGSLCPVALDEIWQARRKFLVMGPGSDEVVADQQRRFSLVRELNTLAGV